MVRKGVFWDRDGIINDLIQHDDKFTAPWDINEFRFKPDIKKSIEIVKDLGYLNFVVTNQPDVNDGWLSESHLKLMNRMIVNWLHVDEIRNAMIRNTPEYKPNNKMVLDLIQEYNIIPSESFMIGDTWKDIVCGYRSELMTVYVGDKYNCPDIRYGSIRPNHIVKTTLDAAKFIQEFVKND